MSEHNHGLYELNPLSVAPATSTLRSAQMEAKTAPVLSAPALGEKFCRFCGNRVVADAVMCVSCGRQIKSLVTAAPPQVTEGKPWSSGEAVLLLLLTLGIPLIGLLFGIKGLCERGKQGQGAGLLVLAIMVSYYWFAWASHPH